MVLIKEPLDLDFVVDSRPLTEKEQLAISAFIKSDKEKRILSGELLIRKRVGSKRTKTTQKEPVVQ